MADVKVEPELEYRTWGQGDAVRVVGAEKVPSIYANNVAIGFSNWDMWITFGEILGEHEGQLLVEPKLRVAMSLEHGKALVEALQTSMAKFENSFGEIRMFVQKEEPESEK